ncbi:MAG TPA: carboxypeptidase-like regulatory domain-containing protein [Aggregicoccus sp.]|nr:carboxypeptidase-like regulatory domain-containing protein [Aggregicoccus sp.]
MRNALLTTASLALCGLLSACGSIDNAPLRVGNVRGRLTLSDPAVAVVSVVGNPDLATSVNPGGKFELRGVPAGAVELFVLASQDSAVRVPVHVHGARTADLGHVAPRPGGFLELEVVAPGAQAVSDATVTIEGTPLRKLKVEGGGARVGPLPEGCYAVTVSAAGFPPAVQQLCVGAGEQKPLKVDLKDDPGYAQHGCQYSGCVDGTVCAADGRCVQCTGDAHCAAGFSCRRDRCEGAGAVCAACDGDWQCAGGSACTPLPEGGSACTQPCTGAASCTQAGFSCQEGRCLPDGSGGASSCSGLQAVGSACSADAECLARDLPRGVCSGGACGLSCTVDAECPTGQICAPGPAGSSVCRGAAP